jgi:ABC-type phosphate transport system substrate-binding protein
VKKWLTVAAGVAALSLPLVAALPAGATTTPPAGYGYDDTPHAIADGGSDTTYRAMTGITDLYNGAAGCPLTNPSTPDNTINLCDTSGSGAETSTLGNWQHDAILQLNPAGSSNGISSLNGAHTNVVYNGALRAVPAFLGSTATGVNVDMGRSSRKLKTASGEAIGGNELAVDTSWGFAQDGLEITAWNDRAAQIQGLGGTALATSDYFHIWNCDWTMWDQVPELGISPGDPTDGPIVAWGMNPGSGTYGTFNDWMFGIGTEPASNPPSGAPSGWKADNQACVRKLANGTYPFENNTAALINDPAALSNSAASVDNPNNWIWFGSFGELSTFPHKSAATRGGTLYQSSDLPVQGIRPNPSNILNGTWQMGRTIWHITRNQEADCPQTVPGTCDFVGHPGPAIPSTATTDLNVTGPTSGNGGAIREFTRWLCRQNANQQGTDPYTGLNYFGEISTAINNAGFTLVPNSLKTGGSRCRVIT